MTVTTNREITLIISASGAYVIIGGCLSVCLLVNSVTQKVMNGFSSNFQRVSIHA